MIGTDQFVVFFLATCITAGILIANLSAYGDDDRHDKF